MRPKKIILLCCRDEARRSVLAFLLRTRGYLVVSGVAGSRPDAAVFVDDVSREPEYMAHVADEAHPDLPLIVMIYPKRMRLRSYPARAWVVPHNIPPVGLLERIRLMCARKRGPKKVVRAEAVQVG